MVNILEILPFLTLKGLTHGPKILSRESSNVVLDPPTKKKSLQQLS